MKTYDAEVLKSKIYIAIIVITIITTAVVIATTVIKMVNNKDEVYYVAKNESGEYINVTVEMLNKSMDEIGKNYDNKYIEINGTVDRILTSNDGINVMSIKMEKDNDNVSNFTTHNIRAEVHDITKYNTGDNVTVQGLCEVVASTNCITVIEEGLENRYFDQDYTEK